MVKMIYICFCCDLFYFKSFQFWPHFSWDTVYIILSPENTVKPNHCMFSVIISFITMCIAIIFIICTLIV